MTKIVAAVAIALVARTGVFAQSLQSFTSDAASRGNVGRAPLVIDVRDVTEDVDVRHRISRRDMAERASLQTPPARRVRHPVLLGAAIGAGAGFVLNASACRTGESVCTSAGNLMMAGIGAGVGAVVGWLVAGR